MDASVYFGTKVIMLRDIKKCVEKAGYTAIFQHKNEKQLFIEFSPDETTQRQSLAT